MLPVRCWSSLLCLMGWAASGPACATAGPQAPPYVPIRPVQGQQPVTLTGHDLSIEDIVAVARHGAPVRLSPEARERARANYGLLLEAAAEDIPVYWFNRGVGEQREVVLFHGDALSAENKAAIEARQLAAFRRGAHWGFPPEVADEEIVRAMMVVRANAMTLNAPSPALLQMLIDLLNSRITPVVRVRGSVGEGDLAQLSNLGAAMVGAGEVYYGGVRMSASTALARAALKPLAPFAADDNALTSSNAYAVGQAALILADARRALEWADLIYALDLNGMDSSITPLSAVVQQDRPGKWLNWDAGRVLQMLRGSYLFGADPARIIQDPESLRASSIRQAAAWEDWAALRDAVLFQANSSDHNPAVRIDVAPSDSWELATPQMMRFYIRGGAASGGRHGYIVSNANWDPYPFANRVESFTNALANMDVAVGMRIERFNSTFFTVVRLEDLLPGGHRWTGGYLPVALQQEIAALAVPLAPSGSAIVGNVEDLQAQTQVKVARARQAVELSLDLLGQDLLNASLWLDARKAQDPSREFGPAPTALWHAFRARVPLRTGAAGGEPADAPVPDAVAAAAFLRDVDPRSFFSGSLP